jgi:hypothetical protein
LASDGNNGRTKQKHLGSDLAETERRGSGAEFTISGSVVHAIPEKRAGCGGIFRHVAENPDPTKQ